MRLLTAIPVHNEEASLVGVLSEVLKHAGDVLVVDEPKPAPGERRYDRGASAFWHVRPCARSSWVT